MVHLQCIYSPGGFSLPSRPNMNSSYIFGFFFAFILLINLNYQSDIYIFLSISKHISNLCPIQTCPQYIDGGGSRGATAPPMQVARARPRPRALHRWPRLTYVHHLVQDLGPCMNWLMAIAHQYFSTPQAPHQCQLVATLHHH